ncbi:hypothetical protein S245_032871, partial [Arachis hypogaea]
MAQTLAMPIAPSLALISNSRPLSRAVYFPVLNPPKVRELSIECARVGGVEIPNNKRIEFSLQYIHGIRRSRARKILCDISMDNKVTKDLSEEDLITLKDEVSKYVIEGDLQQRKKKNNSSMAQTLAMPIAPSLALISNPRPLSRAVYFPVLNPPKVRELSIECARVGRVEIPNNKKIEFSLQYIHGIGRSRARKILCDISMDNKVTKDLSEEDLITLRDEVSKYVIEGDLIHLKIGGSSQEEISLGFMSLCRSLILGNNNCSYGTDSQVKVFFSFEKEAKFTDVKALVFLVVANGLAAGYSLIQGLRCVVSLVRG